MFGFALQLSVIWDMETAMLMVATSNITELALLNSVLLVVTSLGTDVQVKSTKLKMIYSIFHCVY